uniref:BHLH domain-containing protein n=1 Tax=Kalanchoe fedtschenkoi TaxID=63787 RepID=A0A7N0TDZ2_KALFE
MEEDGKLQEEINNMFMCDCGSLSLWGCGDGNEKEMIEVAAELEEGVNNGEENKNREQDVELGKIVMAGGGEGDGEGGGGNDGKREDKTEDPFDFRIQTERERRKKMRNMFGTLHSLVPNLQSKPDKVKIVEETVNYIRTLEQTLQTLQTKKQEKLKETRGSISFNPYSPSSSSMMPPQPHPQPQMVVEPYEAISREALLTEYYLNSSSSSRSITPPNSNAPTPKGHNTTASNSALGSPPIVMIDTPPNNLSGNICGSPPIVMIDTPPSASSLKHNPNLSGNICGSPPIVMIDTPPNACSLKPNTNLSGNIWASPPIVMKPNPGPGAGETPAKVTLSPSSVAFQTFTSKNVVLCVCGPEANFNICGARKPGFYTSICSVLEKYRLEVKSLQVSSEEHSNLTKVMFQARTTALLDQYPVEDIYRAAAVEMAHLVSS